MIIKNYRLGFVTHRFIKGNKEEVSYRADTNLIDWLRLLLRKISKRFEVGGHITCIETISNHSSYINSC